MKIKPVDIKIVFKNKGDNYEKNLNRFERVIDEPKPNLCGRTDKPNGDEPKFISWA